MKKVTIEKVTQLMIRMFKALDDEVIFCYDNQTDIAENSVEILKECETLGIGKSEYLKIVKEQE